MQIDVPPDAVSATISEGTLETRWVRALIVFYVFK